MHYQSQKSEYLLYANQGNKHYSKRNTVSNDLNNIYGTWKEKKTQESLLSPEKNEVVPQIIPPFTKKKIKINLSKQNVLNNSK